MDPLVELLHRWKPEDHSMDRMPLTVALSVLLLIVSISLVLRFTGRAWRTWYRPAFCVFFVWWAGVNIGRYGLTNAVGLLYLVVLVGLLIDPLRRTLRLAWTGPV